MLPASIGDVACWHRVDRLLGSTRQGDEESNEHEEEDDAQSDGDGNENHEADSEVSCGPHVISIVVEGGIIGRRTHEHQRG